MNIGTVTALTQVCLLALIGAYKTIRRYAPSTAPAVSAYLLYAGAANIAAEEHTSLWAITIAFVLTRLIMICIANWRGFDWETGERLK